MGFSVSANQKPVFYSALRISINNGYPELGPKNELGPNAEITDF